MLQNLKLAVMCDVTVTIIGLMTYAEFIKKWAKLAEAIFLG